MAGKFKAYGVEPLFPGYFQFYDFNAKAVLGSRNSVAASVDGKTFLSRN